MKKLPLIARILLGSIFFVFGLNGFLNFIPSPPMEPGKLTDFFNGIMATGYFFPFLKGTEVVCGALLLLGVYVPLALIVLAPIILNIVLVHALLAPSGLPLAIAIAVLETYLAFFSAPYSPTVKTIFKK